ncbi:hypothetical protein [Actinomycetospora aeridis]|uniref:Uncharacterized protein n=1 Tax=Actinomycetospora aeridis TaxID=3129231 RepID=A0ABU8N2J5_9PSEU
MRLRQLAKDKDSGTIGCPSVHVDEETGDLVVQGHGISMEHLPTPLPGEQAVRIDPAIVRAAMQALD